MTEGHGGESHHGPSLKAYLLVFGALSVFTAVSFLVNTLLGQGSVTGMLVILGVAVCKAMLVAAFFMHLVVDWGRVYYLIVPALILGALLVVVLLPDIVLTWHHVFGV